MDKKILGNFIIYFPPIAYIIYTIVIHEKNTGIDWTQIVLTMVIVTISNIIGKQIKNKGEIE